MEKELVQEFVQVMLKLVNKELIKRKFAQYKSAKVVSINEDGSVNIKIPPNETIIHNLLNKTGEALSENDDVSLLLKDGTMSTALVVFKNKTNLIYNGSGSGGGSLTEDILNRINSAIQAIKVNNTLLNPNTNQEVNINIPIKLTDLINDGHFVRDQNYIHTDNNLTNSLLDKINSSIQGIKINDTLLSLNNNQEVNIAMPTNLTELINDGYFIQDQYYIHTDNNFTNTLKNSYNNLVTNVNQTVSSNNKLATMNDIPIVDLSNYYNKEETNNRYVQKETGKGLSSNDFTSDEKTKLAGISNGAKKVEISTINGNIKIDGVENTVYSLTQSEIISVLGFMPSEGGTADLSDYYNKEDSDNRYVQKENGKGLSANNYTTTEKNKLSNIESNAQVNIIEDVKVNGVSLTVTNKSVDVDVPTKVSELNNDSNYVKASELLNKIYPVGAIYISTSSTNPKNLFGGTWEQIKDRFLLSAGNSYNAGGTGGESSHRLTVNEIPSHAHSMRVQWGDYAADANINAGAGTGGASFKVDKGDTTGYSGGNGYHNNMPPYLVVYMWKRTA